MPKTYVLVIAVLIGALVAPHFIEGPDGEPIMTLDDWTEDLAPVSAATTEAYRWQDEHGRWHFSDSADAVPDHVEQIQLTKPVNTFSNNWVEQADALAPRAPAAPKSLSVADVYSGQALEQARAAVGALQERNEALDVLVKQGVK